MSENKQESNLETVILLVLRPALGLYFGHFIILIQNKSRFEHDWWTFLL